jgi:hypothetical protein
LALNLRWPTPGGGYGAAPTTSSAIALLGRLLHDGERPSTLPRGPCASHPADFLSEAEMEFTDRYQALGMPYPDPATMCAGDCEGTGVVPIKGDERDPTYRKLWQEAEAKAPADDGWHFVKCPECGGTGKRKAA